MGVLLSDVHFMVVTPRHHLELIVPLQIVSSLWISQVLEARVGQPDAPTASALQPALTAAALRVPCGIGGLEVLEARPCLQTHYFLVSII